MTCTTKRNMSDAEIQRMASLLRGGASVSAVAEILHRSKDTIRAWARRAGIDLAPATRAWTTDDEAYLLAALAQRTPHADIAKSLNRSHSSISSHINFLGGEAYLRQHQPPPAPEPPIPAPLRTTDTHRDPWVAWKRAMDRLSAAGAQA